MLKTIGIILLVVLIVLLIILAVLYFYGKKMQARQEQNQAAVEAAKQTVSILVIDKKKLRLKDAGFPKIVYEQTPKHMRIFKVPVVKAKVGPRIMSLMSDPTVFEQLPLKQECKVVVSGIYITEIKSMRGGIPKLPEKKGLVGRLRGIASSKAAETVKK